ncbi:MAG: flavin reductase [Lachnospiraceae bacterium]|nr:flavin reductase [Lachnospiraceae bacterium]
MNKKAMYKLSYGLFVLTAKEGDKDNGCIVNTAIQAASTPNQVSVCVNKANYTHDMIMRTGLFTVSIIGQDATFDLFKHFGFATGREVDKFADFADAARAENGLLYVTKGTNAYISVKVTQTVDLGSHSMFVGEVTDMEVLSDVPSATYEYYMANIKPKKPAPAPAPEAGGKTVWVCKICNYEYEGEELPPDYICPLCKHPAEDFEKVVKPADPAPAPAPAEDAGGKTVWVCKICGYEYEGEELPPDYICPLCKHPVDDFEKVVK